jgi:hypothetical protein
MRAASYRLCRLADVLRRVLVPALAASLAMALGPAVPAAARQTSPRIVVITVDGTSIDDWRAAGTFGALGSAGLLATRTGTTTIDPVLLRAAAYTSFGAGSAAAIERGSPAIEAGRGVLAGALGEALHRSGNGAIAIGDGSGQDVDDAPAKRAVMRTDGSTPTPSNAPPGLKELGQTWRLDASAPTGRRTDYRELGAALERRLDRATLFVVDLGDTARADRTFADTPARRAAWISSALHEAAIFVERVRSMLEPSDTLIVASLVPPLARVRAGVHLAAVAMTSGRGLPYSGTTRRPGVLALIDLGPTVLQRAGVAVPEEMQGRSARFEPSNDPSRIAADLDAAFVRARAARRPLTRIWLLLAAALATGAFLTVMAARGRAPGAERFPRRLRDVLAFGLIAVAAVPAALLIAPLLPGAGVAAMGWWTLGLAGGAASLARVTLGPAKGVAAVAMLDAGLVVGDLLAGTPLSSRSPLGFQVAGGGRFYGIDEGLLGVLLAGTLVAMAAWVDGSTRRERTAWAAAVPLGFVAIVAGAPSFGSKFGATFTLVPAFGIFLVLAAGRRLDRTAVTGVAIATVLMSAALAVADALAAPAARSHIGRELAGETPVVPLIARKLASFLEITATTIWLPVAVVIVVPAILLVVRRGGLLARGFWGAPGRRAALVGVAAGCVAAMVSNDTGIIVVAPALVVGAAAFYGPLMAPTVGGVELHRR